jgi:hypothetical protein
MSDQARSSALTESLNNVRRFIMDESDSLDHPLLDVVEEAITELERLQDELEKAREVGA